jgi:hypothetical protein
MNRSAREPIDTVMDVFYLLDIILTFFVGYLKPNGTIILGERGPGTPARRHACTARTPDRQRIAKHYLKSWLITDVLSTLPWDQMTRDHNGLLVQCLRILRLPRCVARPDVASTRCRGRLLNVLYESFAKIEVPAIDSASLTGLRFPKIILGLFIYTHLRCPRPFASARAASPTTAQQRLRVACDRIKQRGRGRLGAANLRGRPDCRS